jgi:hypothetical protein
VSFSRVALFLVIGSAASPAQEKKSDAPRITAIAPMHIVLGETQTIRLRGLKLKEVTEVRSMPVVNMAIKEKKDAAVPNGLEAKDVGDQELLAEVIVPADCTATELAITAVGPAGSSEVKTLSLVNKGVLAEEKEANNGFLEAQLIGPSKPISGRIEPDKDVDVFRVDGQRGSAVNVRITAATAGSLLDPILSAFDTAGRLLATVDDTDGSRDAQLAITPTADGPLMIVVSDANDHGGPWHGYRLEVQTQR